MAQSVSNDALWEKLSEIDTKLEKLSEVQKTSTLSDEQLIAKPDFQKEKDEIIAEIKQQVGLLGKHSDNNFDANRKNIQLLNDNIMKVLNIVSQIRKQQKETVAPQMESKKNYFNFRFFKVWKTSFVIAALALLVLILTLFCMKQQNDYTLLLDEFYRQSIGIRAIQMEVDSLRYNVKPETGRHKK